MSSAQRGDAVGVIGFGILLITGAYPGMVKQQTHQRGASVQCPLVFANSLPAKAPEIRESLPKYTQPIELPLLLLCYPVGVINVLTPLLTVKALGLYACRGITVDKDLTPLWWDH